MTETHERLGYTFRPPAGGEQDWRAFRQLLTGGEPGGPASDGGDDPSLADQSAQ